MLSEFPPERHAELLTMFNKHRFLRVMIKTILKDQTGVILVDNLTRPKVALLTYKVMEFVGGLSRNKNAKEVIAKISENKLLLFPNDFWLRLAKKHLILTAFPRTKFLSRKSNLLKANRKLRKKELPKGYSLKKISYEILENINPKIAPTILPFYKSPADFIERGMGYCIIHDEKKLVVSIAASAMPIYDDEFDLLVVTDPDPNYRRKGFATIAATALIGECLERGIKLHFDSDSEISTRFALKLGFSRPQHYTAYICSRNFLKEKRLHQQQKSD
ncbi:MAG: GNAT family N-acetyltransferase [Candidatus Heimdallarchaeota archaeon]|nr:GNAT family N-acetyltransferase [Candidatus Heimdallarchaeota archaeon]